MVFEIFHLQNILIGVFFLIHYMRWIFFLCISSIWQEAVKLEWEFWNQKLNSCGYLNSLKILWNHLIQISLRFWISDLKLIYIHRNEFFSIFIYDRSMRSIVWQIRKVLGFVEDLNEITCSEQAVTGFICRPAFVCSFHLFFPILGSRY